jgi:glutamate-1-semialdehyde 2,1-aminomutase
VVDFRPAPAPRGGKEAENLVEKPLESVQNLPIDVFGSAARQDRVRSRTAASWQRWLRSQRSLAGGVSSGLRRSARPYPLFFSSGSGARITDADGNRYLDYTLAWGPLILGHCPEPVVAAVAAQLRCGFTYGAQHDLEFEVAEQFQRLVPCAGRICYANSGTEIVQLALRLARALTGRPLHLKFEGHYHGWDDSVLVSYHPSADEINRFGTSPVPVGLGQRAEPGAVIAEWNDPASVDRAFQTHAGRIASILCEPMLCNSGCIPPAPGFLAFLKERARQEGSLLIFDEVITGFRLALGGAQAFYGVVPDLATFAKAAGGGLPLSVLAGREELVEPIADGRVVHAGTLNGNPLALAAAKATLATLEAGGEALYRRLWRLGDQLRDGLAGRLGQLGLPVSVNGGGPVFQISFQAAPPRNYRETLGADRMLYSDFALAMLDEGVLVLPDGRWYLSAAHTDQDIAETLAAADRVVASAARS